MKEKKKNVSKIEENVLVKEALVEETKMKLYQIHIRGLAHIVYVIADCIENAIKKVQNYLADYSEVKTEVEGGVIKQTIKKLEGYELENISELAIENKGGVFGDIKLY